MISKKKKNCSHRLPTKRNFAFPVFFQNELRLNFKGFALSCGGSKQAEQSVKYCQCGPSKLPTTCNVFCSRSQKIYSHWTKSSWDPKSQLHIIQLPVRPTSILLDTSSTIYSHVREKSLVTDTVPYQLSSFLGFIYLFIFFLFFCFILFYFILFLFLFLFCCVLFCFLFYFILFVKSWMDSGDNDWHYTLRFLALLK